MNKLGIVVLIVCLGLTLVTEVGFMPTIDRGNNLLAETDGQEPTIEWAGPDNASETVVLAWDGAYTGQTEESWTLSARVNDTDGIDNVIFFIRDANDDTWESVTPTRVEGNDTYGRYSYNYTYAVWWNYTRNSPQVEGTGGNFDFKIFANDTLGHHTETGILTYTGGYMIVYPPPEITLLSNLIPTLVAVGAIILIIGVVVVVRRR